MMGHDRQQAGAHAALRGMAVSAVAWAISLSRGAVALATDGSYMTNIDPEDLFDSDGTVKAGVSLATKTINVIQSVTTGFLLPVGIGMSIWRSAYFAIFCVMASTDPLHLLNEKNLTRIIGDRGTSGKSRRANRVQGALEMTTVAQGDFEYVNPEIGMAALKDELRKSARSLVVVFGLWTFIQIIARIVYWVFLVLEG